MYLLSKSLFQLIKVRCKITHQAGYEFVPSTATNISLWKSITFADNVDNPLITSWLLALVFPWQLHPWLQHNNGAPAFMITILLVTVNFLICKDLNNHTECNFNTNKFIPLSYSTVHCLYEVCCSRSLKMRSFGIAMHYATANAYQWIVQQKADESKQLKMRFAETKINGNSFWGSS